MRIEVRLRAGLWRVSRSEGGELSSHIDPFAATERARRIAAEEQCEWEFIRPAEAPAGLISLAG